MNDHFARILHEDRMTEYRGDAWAFHRVAGARRGTVKRRSSTIGFALLAVTVTLLVLSGVLVLPAAA